MIPTALPNDTISWEYRKKYWAFQSPVAAVDVTRTRIPRPWDIHKPTQKETMKKYWSGKDKFHALKYELLVSLGPYCKIVLVSGGYPGAVHDMTIVRQLTLPLLDINEKLVADRGYIGDHRLLTPVPEYTVESRRLNKIMNYLRQNVERMNNRVKNF